MTRFVLDASVTLCWWILGVARQHRLSAYDAAYLDLAIREGLTLATQDAELRTAARGAGVKIT